MSQRSGWSHLAQIHLEIPHPFISTSNQFFVLFFECTPVVEPVIGYSTLCAWSKTRLIRYCKPHPIPSDGAIGILGYRAGPNSFTPRQVEKETNRGSLRENYPRKTFVSPRMNRGNFEPPFSLAIQLPRGEALTLGPNR